MSAEMTRRGFLGATAAGAASFGAAGRFGQLHIPGAVAASVAGSSKVRVGKVYMGRPRPGWPMAKVELAAEVKRFEQYFAKLQRELADVEFVNGGLVSTPKQLPAVKGKFKGVDGILVIHLTLGIGGMLHSLLELGIPTMMFTMPYAGHEWHIIASMQRLGKPIDVLPSSDYRDLAVAVRPFRAMRRLREAKILYLRDGGPDPKYVKAIKDKFGTEIKTLHYKDLERAYKAVKEADAKADAERWIREAQKIVEPSRDEIVRSSRMYLAMRNLLEQEKAVAIAINCLGMGLIDRGLAYPCLGFSRLNSMGLGGICEADLKSAMTHLIFTYLVGKPGFISDPVFDYATGTIIHAHCVAATHMDGPAGPAAPYVIRSHLEDNRGASLQVKMRVGQKISMARLIGSDILLFSTGEIIDTPDVNRGCRTKITTKVDNPEKFLENWSCGLHRVIFYGDHTQDIRRFCRFMKIRLLREGIDDLRDVPGLEWSPHVHA